MRSLNEDSLFDRVMLGLGSVIGLTTPITIIMFVRFWVMEGFSFLTGLLLVISLFGLFCLHFSRRIKDIKGEFEKRERQIKRLEESTEKEVEVKRSIIAREMTKANVYCNQKRREIDDYEARKRIEADTYAIAKKKSADDYYIKKHEEIEDHRVKRQGEIDVYKKKRQKEIDAYKEKIQEELDEYQEEVKQEIDAWKYGDDTLYNLRQCELEEYKNKFGITDEKQVAKAIKSEFPFTYSASMSADFEAALFEKEEKRLRWKSPRALSAADSVSDIKKKFRKSQGECKAMLYKYEFLLTAFPELRKYVDDEKGLLSLVDANSYDDFTEKYDRAKDYLSDEEYRRLSETQRNQLALDHYNAKPKSDWVIGTEYEMYCEYLLRNLGYKTTDFGVRNRLNDLGRDIIAKKDNVTYVIQCKRWSTNKTIHENVICQLYGTTIEYNLQTNRDNKNPTLFDEDLEVVPKLMTTTELSDTAKLFAEKLGVEIQVIKMGLYPQIKCNISNTGEKIYHLPFDQQYYNTRINERNGEMYAWTVEEAERNGFRRAFRWQGNSN